MLNMSPYLVFKGHARPALTFYQSVFGGRVTISTFSDFSQGRDMGALADQVMHGQLETESFTLMASDDPTDADPLGAGNTQICLWGDDLETARAWFTALSDGGQVGAPFDKQMWGDHYGDVVDRFGVTWSVNAGDGQ